MSSYKLIKSDSRGLLSLLALTFACSLLLVVVCGPQVTKAALNRDGDEEFFDAEEDFGDDDEEMADARDSFQDGDHHDDDGDETWYDVEEEFGYDEEAGEKVCVASNQQDCSTCCRRSGFDLPHWSKPVGQCLCYLSEGDQNICKGEPNKSGGSCSLCCKSNHYELSYFSDRSSTCYCSVPNESFYGIQSKVTAH